MVENDQGHESCRVLVEALERQFGAQLWINDLPKESDGFGWRLNSRPRYCFSISTRGGEMPFGVYDLQVSIIDDSLENGEIVFGPESPELNCQNVCDIVAQFIANERS